MFETTVYKKAIQIMIYGDNRNWHERNSGNLTYCLTDNEIKEMESYFEYKNKKFKLDNKFENLANKYFLVSGSGQFFCNVKKYTDKVLGIIKINESGDGYEIIYGLNDGMPTSELMAHLSIHNKNFTLKNLKRVVYHCHPTNMVALTFVHNYDSYEYSAKLWQAATECSVVIPNGVGLLPWMMPGSIEIATETAKMMEEFDLVVWVHHGVFVSSDTLDNAIGSVHVCEKAAEIVLKVMSTRSQQLNTISRREIVSLAKEFSITLNERIVEKL